MTGRFVAAILEVDDVEIVWRMFRVTGVTLLPLWLMWLFYDEWRLMFSSRVDRWLGALRFSFATVMA